MDFLKKALSEQDGLPSSKRLMAFISCLFFVIVFIFILGYLVVVGKSEPTAIERNLVTILTAAGSLPAVLQGLTLFNKNENGGV